MQKLHQTIMKIKKSNKMQLLIIYFSISLSFINWGSGLKAQSSFTYGELSQTDMHVNEQDTTRATKPTEISIIEEPNSNKEKKSSVTGSDLFFKNRGYMSFVSIGLLPGSQDVITTTPVSLDMSHGFYYPTGIYIGAGLAVETFDPAIMPIFGDLRFFLTKKNAKPLIRATLGYSIPISNRPNYKEKGGVNAGIGGGMIFSMNNQAAFYFYLGYRFLKLTGTSTDYSGQETKLITEFNRMEFRIGLSFH